MRHKVQKEKEPLHPSKPLPTDNLKMQLNHLFKNDQIQPIESGNNAKTQPMTRE